MGFWMTSWATVALCSFACLLMTSCALVKQGSGTHKVEILPGVSPELVLIPGGEFTMGSNGKGDYSPPHRVRLNSFYMDKYEVTNAQYLAYCKATGARLPEFWGMADFRCGAEYPDHPVVGIAWTEAKAYAEWAEKRLPTEAEWEYAARGGLVGKSFPRGNKLESDDANHWRWDVLRSSGDGLVPVGRYPPNGYGLHDMAGNVAEWVADAYDEDYYRTSSVENPTGPGEGRFRVFRGGGWHSGPSCNRVYYRNALPGNWRDFNVGFRCAKDIEAD